MNRKSILVLAGGAVIFGALAMGAFFQVRGSEPEREQTALKQSRSLENQLREQGQAGGETLDAGGADPQVQDPEQTGPKADNGGNYEPDPSDAPDPGAPPADASGLSTLSSRVTAQKSFSDETISIAFYAQGPGYFTVQQKEPSGEWSVTRENVFYPGSGGIEAGSLAAGQPAVTLRLLKVEDGNYAAVSSEFTVSRREVTSAGGIKTYSG